MPAKPDKSQGTATDLLNTVPTRLDSLIRPSRSASGVDLLLDDLKAPKQPPAAAPAK